MRALRATKGSIPVLPFSCSDLATGRRASQGAKSLSFSVRSGERVVITGGNGTGKTNFLRTIAGYIPHLRGSGEVLGMQLGKVPSYVLFRQGLSFIGDDRGVFTSLTIREQVELAIGRPYTLEAGRDILSPLQLIASRPKAVVSTLSGGERQVLGIGCALARNPRLLLVDELTQGLQSDTKHLVLRRLLLACDTDGLSIIFTDDDESVVEQLASRRLNMETGICSDL